MNRTEYMKDLAYRLRRLPKEDYDRAMEYFEEYFCEAGPEHEQEAIHDLGTPSLAADQIITDLAIRNASEEPKNVKRSFSAVWVGILAVFAAPVALPLALCFAAMIVVMIFMVIVLAAAVLCMMVALMAAGVVGVFGSVYLLFHSFSSGLATLGASLAAMGVGLPLAYGCVIFCRWFLHQMTIFFGKLAKGGRNREKNN